jgi:hypothetical protein
MGRKPWTNRLTVEECPIQLSITKLARDGVLEFSHEGPAAYSTTRNAVEIARIGFEIHFNGLNHSLHLPPQQFRLLESSQFSTGQRIILCGNRCVGQAKRFWFICACKRRAGILYLPPDTIEFRCRICHNLTYRSSQTRKPLGWVSRRRKQTKPNTSIKVWALGSRSPIDRRKRSYGRGLTSSAQSKQFTKEEIDRFFEKLNGEYPV